VIFAKVLAMDPQEVPNEDSKASMKRKLELELQIKKLELELLLQGELESRDSTRHQVEAISTPQEVFSIYILCIL